MNPLVLALIALLGLGLVFLIVLKGGQVETKEIPCGGEEEFEANRAADTQFVVVVDQVCSDEAKIQVGSKTWTDVVVLRPPITETEDRRENAKPGSAYFITVPRGQKLKVLCPSGTNADKCIVRVANLSAQLRNPIAVNKPANPVTTKCGSWTEAKLYNLSRKPAVVRLRFTKVCKADSRIDGSSFRLLHFGDHVLNFAPVNWRFGRYDQEDAQQPEKFQRVEASGRGYFGRPFPLADSRAFEQSMCLHIKELVGGIRGRRKPSDMWALDAVLPQPRHTRGRS